MQKNNFINAIKDFVNDVGYFEKLVKSEAFSLKSELSDKIEKSSDPYKHLSIVADHLIESLAALTVRIQLIESSLTSEKEVAPLNLSNSISSNQVLQFVDEILITADSFSSQPNFYGEEITDSGLYYSWTGPLATNCFDLPLTRHEKKFGQFRFISIVDEEEIKNIMVKIDGVPVPVEIGAYQEQRVIEFPISPLQADLVTKVSLHLAKTVSPAEIGQGQDTRLLGIALSGVSVTMQSVLDNN
jgi:hypothetical protein